MWSSHMDTGITTTAHAAAGRLMAASEAVQQRSGPVQLSILGVLIAAALILFALAMSMYLSLGLHSPLLISTLRYKQVPHA